MQVIDKTMDLIEYTHRATDRKGQFPLKYRSFILEMQTSSIHIYKLLLKANRLPIAEYSSDRKKSQLDAVALCDELSGLIELSHRLKIISFDKMEKWQDYLTPVKNMILAWIKSDSKR